MTKLVCSDSTRIASYEGAILLNSRHCLLSDIPLPSSRDIAELCGNIDVLHASPINFTIAGVYNGRRISHEELMESMALEVILGYLRKYSGELGISSVSVPYIDEAEGSLKFAITPLRSAPVHSLQPHIILLSIDLKLDWNSVKAKKGFISDNHEKHNPFLGRMLLPSQMLLRKVLDRFVDAHILRRYPLIFGSRIQRLDLESAYFLPLSKAILRVVERSENDMLRQECKTMLRSLKKRHLKAHWSSRGEISKICGSNMFQEPLEAADQNLGSDGLEISFQHALCLSMDHIFRDHTNLAPFKDTKTPEPDPESDSEDHGFDFSTSRDLLLDSSENSQDLSQSSSLFSDEEEPIDVLFHENYPSAAFKTTAPSSDTCQEKPKSSDVHATWDGYSGGKGTDWELLNDLDNPAPLTNQADILLSDDNDDDISEASSINLVPDDDDPPFRRKSCISLVPELVDDSDDVPPMEVLFDLNSDLFDEETSSEYDATLSYDFSSSKGFRGVKESANTSLDSAQSSSATLRDADIDYELGPFDTNSAASSLPHQDLQEHSATMKADISVAMLIDNEDDLVAQHHCFMSEWNVPPADIATPCDTFSVLSDHDDDPCNEDDNDLLWRDELRRDAGLV